MNEHVSLHFVLPIERRLTQSAFVWFFTWKTQPESLHTAGIQTYDKNEVETLWRKKPVARIEKRQLCFDTRPE